MKVIFAIAGMSALLAGCSQASPAPDEIATNSAALVAYLDAEYEEELQFSPEEMTSQGRKDKYSELDDRSEAGGDRRLEWRRQSVADMKARFKTEALDEDARLSYDIWALELERAEKATQFRRHRYIFGRNGAHTGLPTFLINEHRVDDRPDMEAYISRVGAIGAAIDQLLERAKHAAADGIRMPAFAYDMTASEVKRVAAGAPFGPGKDSALFADGKAKIKALHDEKKITADEGKVLETQLSAAMTGKMKPAYDRLSAWVGEDKKNALLEPQGVGGLPNGAEYYKTALYLQTTTTMTSDEIHQLGLSEVSRIRGEMERVKGAAGFKGTLEEFFVFMRADRRFYLPNNDSGANEYVKRAEDYLAGMKARLPEYFGLLPKADLVVKRVEPYREEPGGAQHYRSATPDGSRPGTFYAHLSDMNAMPTYQLENIAYHEGLPGHHMQLSIQQELTGLPKFRTQYGYTAYSEGWGLYSEALAKEMGFDTDPYNDFGRLAGEIWRAIRLVVDTGIHAKGWSEEQAIRYFTENSPQPETAIRSEVRRYITTPGQATCYKIGMIRLQQMRDKARAALKDRFTYRAFHDQVLGGGSLPLPVLEARIDRWIERERGGATSH
jgi:uncharacterized protein (DUF885 family)